ncbi:MAG: hypothetical protein P8K73_04625 [Methylophilaceae bacterium]|jgi:hypothetical protein|nr:hypothetical protein [Methylophilaceae bacterium]
MDISEEIKMAYKIANTQINVFPYPHLYVKNVFTDEYYAQIIKHLPHYDQLRTISDVRPIPKGGYLERFALNLDDKSLGVLSDKNYLFWSNLRKQFLSGGIKNFLLSSKFSAYVESRFSNFKELEFFDELLLINDTLNYSLGPHTDSPKKVMSFLFYLPKDESQINLGTSIYVPKDTSFNCIGLNHYSHDDFIKIHTNDFLPNSLFGFIKTNNSFHGVEKIVSDERRWVLLYDIYVKDKGK